MYSNLQDISSSDGRTVYYSYRDFLDNDILYHYVVTWASRACRGRDFNCSAQAAGELRKVTCQKKVKT
jgi:hypothetical protein